ncbi:hypothetical protein L1049_002262 [Liquidambar formosana]|uniref:Uncharacterized protein n=1 Tax=Liquidambar formosana TaxID=63359 RepID=A0AAP0NH01_LIQFO
MERTAFLPRLVRHPTPPPIFGLQNLLLHLSPLPALVGLTLHLHPHHHSLSPHFVRHHSPVPSQGSNHSTDRRRSQPHLRSSDRPLRLHLRFGGACLCCGRSHRMDLSFRYVLTHLIHTQAHTYSGLRTVDSV